MIKYINLVEMDETGKVSFDESGKEITGKFPIRVSYYVLKMLKEKDGIDFNNIPDDDYKAQESLLFYALEKGHKVMGLPFNIKREQMEDIIDYCWQDFVKLIPEFFKAPTGGELPISSKKALKG
jgi:hypothetical protein